VGRVTILSEDESLIFQNRAHAGRTLAEALQPEMFHQPVVVAIPRGGIPIAIEIATRLNADLDFVLPRKLGAPGNPELAIGAVSQDGDLVLNEELVRSLHIPELYIEEVKERELQKIQQKAAQLRQWIPEQALEGRDVILTDDGVATGSTFLAGLRLLRKHHPRRLIGAVPVLPRDTLTRLASMTDLFVAVIAPYRFLGAVGAYYLDFHQVGDAEVEQLIAQFQQHRTGQQSSS